MKLKIRNEDLDLYADSVEQVEAPRRRWRVSIFSRLIRALRALFLKIWNVNTVTLPSFSNLTLGGYLRCSQCKKPSEVVKVICDDLHIESLPPYEAITYYVSWKEKLENITLKFAEYQPKVKDEPVFQMYWKQCVDRLHIPQHQWVVDKIAQRFHCTYDEAYSMSVADVLTAIAIDCASQEYESRVHQHYEQQSKIKR